MDFRNRKFSIFICVAALIFSAWAPFIAGNALGSDFMRLVVKGIVGLSAVLLMVYHYKDINISLFEILIMLAIFANAAYNCFYTYNGTGKLSVISVLLCIFFLLQPNFVRAITFRYFKKIVVYTTFICIVCYLSYMLNLGIPHTIVPRGSYIVTYINYQVCYLMNINDTLIRFNGMFDEPGYYGTFAAFFICADGMNLKKKDNLILFVGGFLSLSLGFFMLIFIYYLISNITKWRRWIILGSVLTLFMFIPNIQTGNYYVDTVLSRMEINDEGLAGDNRYGSSFERVWDETLKSDKIYTGYGAGFAEYFGTSETEGLASIKSYFVNFGIIGTLIIFSPLIFASFRLALRLKNKHILYYIAISFISLYQRPCIFMTDYFAMFLCGISYILLMNKNIGEGNG